MEAGDELGVGGDRAADDHGDRVVRSNRPGGGDGLAQRVESLGERRGQRHQLGPIAGEEAGQVGGGDVGPQVGDGPALLAEHLVEAGQADAVVLPGDPGEDGERTDAAGGPGLLPDAIQGPDDGLAGKVLLGDRPASLRPAIADDAHRVAEQAVEDLGPAALRERTAQRPCRELVVAVGQQARQHLRRDGGGRRRSGSAGGVDRREEGKSIAHRGDSTTGSGGPDAWMGAGGDAGVGRWRTLDRLPSRHVLRRPLLPRRRARCVATVRGPPRRAGGSLRRARRGGPRLVGPGAAQPPRGVPGALPRRRPRARRRRAERVAGER